jgi:hypothetical protein
MYNKKAISAVVATVLIILITVAAVTIIWAAVIPMIKENTLGGTVCLDAVSGLSLETEGGYTCKNVGDNITLQISHGAKSFALEDVQVLISENGTTETLSIKFNSSESPVDLSNFTENEAKVFTLDLVTNTNPAYVEIAPVVAIGASTKTCDVAAKVDLPVCA